ncbi:MAG: AraC family transcriptional regulator [Pseudomonadota bacterium]
METSASHERNLTVEGLQDAMAFLAPHVHEFRCRRLGTDWAGVEAVVAHQGGCEFVSPVANFHFLEMCVGGSLKAINRLNGLATPAECVYRPGALFLLPERRAVHHISGKGDVLNLQVAIDPTIMRDVKADMVKGDPESSDILGYNEVFNPTIHAAMSAIHRELIDPQAGGAMVAEAMAQAICVEIVRRFSTKTLKQPQGKHTLSPAQLSAALEFIDENLSRNIGLNDVASAAGFSTSHFLRAFTAAFGKSPHAHLTDCRIGKARLLLADRKQTIAEIAVACGFYDQPHMTKVFKKQLGLTPGRYRADIER